MEDTPRQRLGHALRAARLARGLTQAQVGALIGRDRTTVSDWERGLSMATLEDLGPICRALEVPCEWFLEPASRPELVGRRTRRRK